MSKEAEATLTMYLRKVCSKQCGYDRSCAGQAPANTKKYRKLLEQRLRMTATAEKHPHPCTISVTVQEAS